LILLNLTLPDLLRLQLVNSHWYQTITRSPSLEVNMFYKALGASDGGAVLRFSSTSSSSSDANDANDANADDADNKNSFFNLPTTQLQKHPCSPLLLFGSAVLGTCTSYFDKETASMATIKGLVFCVRAVDVERLDREFARRGGGGGNGNGDVVWRRAFVTQPPTDEVTVLVCREGAPFVWGRGSVVRVGNAEGVRLGDVVDRVREVLGGGDGEVVMRAGKEGKWVKRWERVRKALR
ncbi:hypothetical protein LTS18_005128, partial [Coniosporium uncinatum]